MPTYYEKNKEKVRMYYQKNREKILKSISDKYDNISTSEYNRLYYLGYRIKKQNLKVIKTITIKKTEKKIESPIKKIKSIGIHELLDIY